MFLKKVGFIDMSETLQGAMLLDFEKNNESKIYDKDTSLFGSTSTIYKFGEAQTKEINFSWSGKLYISAGGYNIDNVVVVICKNDVYVPVKNIFMISDVGTSYVNIEIPQEKYILPSESYSVNDNFFVYIIVQKTEDGPVSVSGDFFIDIKKRTNVNVLHDNGNILYRSVSNILNTIFNNQITSTLVNTLSLTSANCLTGIGKTANFKPTDFVRDLCIANGAIINFKKNGGVTLDYIDSYFNNLLREENAIEITNFKDFNIKYCSDLNFASVKAGQEINEYDIYTYLINWNKILTFNQPTRNASENLDLSLQKFRADFSGIIDYFYKQSQQNIKSSKDVFLFHNNFSFRNSNTGDYIYDLTTTKDILFRWSRFLSFIFENFNLDTLELSSNGGTEDNLIIGISGQLENLELQNTPKCLPIEIQFIGLIPEIDFTEKILKVVHNSEIFYIFVTNAETTDKLSEQKITGLKIEL